MKSTVGAIPLAFSTSVANTKSGYTYAAGKGGKSIIVSGMDYLTPISVPANTQPGYILYNQALNPRALAQSRLASFAALFDRYIPVLYSLEYEPSCPAFTSGTILLYIDRDSENNPGQAGTNPGIGNVKRGTAQINSISTTCYSKATTSYRHTDDNKTHTNFYCDPGSDDNDAYFGRSIVLLSAGLGNLEPVQLGTLYMKYRFEFFLDQLGIPDAAIGTLTNWFAPVTTAANTLYDIIAKLDTPPTTGASIAQIKPATPLSTPFKILDCTPYANGSIVQLVTTVPKLVGSLMNFTGYLTGGLQLLTSVVSDNSSSPISVYRALYKVISNANAFLGHAVSPSITQPVYPQISISSVPIVEELDAFLLSDTEPELETVIESDGHWYTRRLHDDTVPLPKKRK